MTFFRLAILSRFSAHLITKLPQPMAPKCKAGTRGEALVVVDVSDPLTSHLSSHPTSAHDFFLASSQTGSHCELHALHWASSARGFWCLCRYLEWKRTSVQGSGDL